MTAAQWNTEQAAELREIACEAYFRGDYRNAARMWALMVRRWAVVAALDPGTVTL